MSQYFHQTIRIGDVKIGGKHAISLQSMTSTPTMNTVATVEQVIRIAQVGAHMVRITARNIREAKNLSLIKKELAAKGYHLPLIADIHFNPKAANVAATIVDKVRINPGNYMDKRSGKTSWTEEEYHHELQQIKERLKDFVNHCKTHQTVIRVGVNHGSLSDRVVNRYGNTANGMAESALEFIHIFESLKFQQLVISLKASNVLVMVEANKLLMNKMKARGYIYPLHLGVTEAGDAEDGRIKSAMGIGCLLAQDIGDTIRVSLTEEAEYEIPVAQKIVRAAQENRYTEEEADARKFYRRRDSYKLDKIGHSQIVSVISSFRNQQSNTRADYFFNQQHKSLETYEGETIFTYLSLDDLINDGFHRDLKYFTYLTPEDWTISLGKKVSCMKNLLIVLVKSENTNIHKIHELLKHFKQNSIQAPLILKIESPEKDLEKLLIHSSIQAGSFLIKGALDGIWIEAQRDTSDLAFGILQASRQRISKTEYIVCPSCGRTLFNIQEKLQEVKSKTQEFVGLKIAVMGCIVNGLGEMADADYGYVGAGPGKMNLYQGHELIMKNIPDDEAADQLLTIIKKKHHSL